MSNIIEIRLRKGTWRYDKTKLLGKPGGFGAVFEGFNEKGEVIAVKRLHVTAEEAGHRELQIAEELEKYVFENVIPIYDSGYDADSDSYYVVMAKAEYSLGDFLKRTGPLSETDGIDMLIQIAHGIKEASFLVHRDLKPDNILLHEGKWKITDFGIAKFVENATSLQTLKDCLSPPYAAPEQWLFERSVNTTDIYAFGCIAYEILAGRPPFIAVEINKFRDLHLHTEPSRISVSQRMWQLLSLCLRKNPKSRPSIERVCAFLKSLKEEGNTASPLAGAAAIIADNEAKTEAENVKKLTEIEKRKELARDGFSILEGIIEEMFDVIEREAPVAKINRPAREIFLGSGKLKIMYPFWFLDLGVFKHSRWDVICGALIFVSQENPRYKERSANLWYADLNQSGEYRWFEVSYWIFGGDHSKPEPFGVCKNEELRDVDYAASNVMHTYNIARKSPIDFEETKSFIDRYTRYLAKAATNSMQHPSSLPEGE
jgi:eukaryotic-like serine/threonine-protein kinase